MAAPSSRRRAGRGRRTTGLVLVLGPRRRRSRRSENGDAKRQSNAGGRRHPASRGRTLPPRRSRLCQIERRRLAPVLVSRLRSTFITGTAGACRPAFGVFLNEEQAPVVREGERRRHRTIGPTGGRSSEGPVNGLPGAVAVDAGQTLASGCGRRALMTRLSRVVGAGDTVRNVTLFVRRRCAQAPPYLLRQTTAPTVRTARSPGRAKRREPPPGT